MGYLDDVETHVDDVLPASAVVTSSGIAFQGITEIPTVKVVVAQVVIAASYALFDRVASVVFQICV